MSSSACNDPAAAAEDFLQSIHISDRLSSEGGNDDDCGSVPPSPELGMAREGEGDISDADLSLKEEEDSVDPSPSGTLSSVKSVDSATSTTSTAGHDAKQPRMCENQQSPPMSARKASFEPEFAQLTTPTLTCPPTRRSARAKGSLVYDQKYHPMDDFIRPSQAAKRRSLHGEAVVLSSNSDTSSEQSGSDVGSIAGDEDSDEGGSQPPTRGRQGKRKRSRSRTPEPTRRSSRRKAMPKVSYNMRIHPQDSDLARVYACDGSRSSPSPNKRERFGTESPSKKSESFKACDEACHVLPTDALRDDTISTLSPELSSQHVIANDPPRMLDRKLCDAYPNLCPDVAYLTDSQNVWPDIKGLSFSIFTERMEDQLDAEAEAASPFHYNDNDKENDVTNPELTPRPNPLDGISIIPASHYRQRLGLHALPSHGALVSNALYAHPRFEASPYGLGWSDGAHDLNNDGTHDCPVDEYMRILASSENLPRSSSHTEDRSGGSGTAVSSSLARNAEGLELLR
ncbi:uncharacterized protein EKO05_0009228 [Ascochyta rabiei]|uniref:uncharacterized protein n=1 Tax=Didymella rabiei TaxID=5454 RepID=UPI0022074D04|nr:uncharacterized protein EKO05_0009228 [Ascochyta rabiei]UPX18948.1 hypothetical protein EKO05_0009228 [Ascochyta rabiei]